MSSSPDNALKRLTSYQNLSSDNSNLRNKIEELKKQLELAQNERQKLENENAKRKSIALQLSGKIRRWEELLKEKELVYEDEKRALEIASLEFESAKRDFDYFQANIKSQREQFLERSRVFREKCKQLRLEASMNGMEYACVQAWTNLHGVGCPSHFDSLDAIAHDDDDIDADPSAWKAIDDNDDEMKEAMAMFLKEKRKFEEAKQEFDEAEENKERLVDRAEDGQHRKEQLVKQLQRIQKDNADLEEQIAQAARLGEEAKQKRLSRKFQLTFRSVTLGLVTSLAYLLVHHYRVERRPANFGLCHSFQSSYRQLFVVSTGCESVCEEGPVQRQPKAKEPVESRRSPLFSSGASHGCGTWTSRFFFCGAAAAPASRRRPFPPRPTIWF